MVSFIEFLEVGPAFNFNPLEQHERAQEGSSYRARARVVGLGVRPHEGEPRPAAYTHGTRTNLLNPIKEPRRESSGNCSAN